MSGLILHLFVKQNNSLRQPESAQEVGVAGSERIQERAQGRFIRRNSALNRASD